ncbi:MAG: hypothetical protein FRX49_11882 [Trebouxia sp. A1-2]|nr:MAG: hypothetical protein FRX49_11882 [Trebouxia sp. A1-2]
MSSKLRVERQISLIAREEAEDGCQWQLATVPLSPLRQDVALRPQLGVLEIALGEGVPVREAALQAVNSRLPQNLELQGISRHKVPEACGKCYEDIASASLHERAASNSGLKACFKGADAQRSSLCIFSSQLKPPVELCEVRITQEVAHALKELLPQAKPLNMVDSPASDSPDASEAFLADLLDIIHAQVDRTNRKRDAGNTAKSLDAAMGRAGGSRA